jgi:hypothetical protein
VPSYVKRVSAPDSWDSFGREGQHYFAITRIRSAPPQRGQGSCSPRWPNRMSPTTRTPPSPHSVPIRNDIRKETPAAYSNGGIRGDCGAALLYCNTRHPVLASLTLKADFHIGWSGGATDGREGGLAPDPGMTSRRALPGATLVSVTMNGIINRRGGVSAAAIAGLCTRVESVRGGPGAAVGSLDP